MSIYNECLKVKEASWELATLGNEQKNTILKEFADSLIANAKEVIGANKIDILNAQKNELRKNFTDRLILNNDRIKDIAESIYKIIDFDDPIGKITEERTIDKGLELKKITVPLGVIGIIYEARPNVTADSIALCFKSGNACILRGGKEAIHTNMQIVQLMKSVLKKLGYNNNFLYLVEDTSRESANEMMTMNGVIDVLIPRGGASLIQSVIKNSTVPVIETGAGNCHAYVDEEYDENIAYNVVLSAKISRPSVCNSLEKLLVNEKIADKFIPKMYEIFKENNVEVRGCEKACAILNNSIKSATSEDWYTEYNDFIISIKVVKEVKEAVEHIRNYSTSHSETIITENEKNRDYFLKNVDSAAVYVNASTRFTDGGVFGLGAEIGISTQKLHARGPMGLNELTSYKYVVYGSGQIR